jgi:hypothetical protein
MVLVFVAILGFSAWSITRLENPGGETGRD